MSTKQVSVLGATGSVGQSTLSVIAHANQEAKKRGDLPVFAVDTLAAGQQVETLAQQAIDSGAKLAVIADEAKYSELKARLEGTGIDAAAGAAAIVEAARRPCDRLVAAIVGAAGLRSTLAAIEAGNDVALANKESMVCAGSLLKSAAQMSGARIVPMDSEHSAIFQVLQGRDDLEKLIVTASGGPFLDTPQAELGAMSVERARAHPRWSMGLKISIDSSTLMNKALEVIEASYLFDVPGDQIDVVVHPQSIIHSMVSYRDGSVLAQLGEPDMRTPIAFALSWPDRRVPTAVKRLDLTELSQLDFRPVDDQKFPAIGLAKRALKAGGAAPLILNCANEAAVAAFIVGKCGFLDISSVVGDTLEEMSHSGFSSNSMANLEEIDVVIAEAQRVSARLLAK
ncbi:MAG: 1-deoxy-D-xylulose-5-phosphate reductoisomerase [Hyphomonadaceae bacterium]